MAKHNEVAYSTTEERVVLVGKSGKVAHKAMVTTGYNCYDEAIETQVEKPSCGAIHYRSSGGSKTAQAITILRAGTPVTCDKC